MSLRLFRLLDVLASEIRLLDVLAPNQLTLVLAKLVPYINILELWLTTFTSF